MEQVHRIICELLWRDIPIMSEPDLRSLGARTHLGEAVRLATLRGAAAPAATDGPSYDRCSGTMRGASNCLAIQKHLCHCSVVQFLPNRGRSPYSPLSWTFFRDPAAATLRPIRIQLHKRTTTLRLESMKCQRMSDKFPSVGV